MTDPFDWLALFANFLLLSLVAIGGALVLVPDMHRLMVEQYAMLTGAQFAAAVAIAQASPGPNVLFVAVLGFQAAGVGGAAATLLGIMLPSSTLTVAASRWSRSRQHLVAIQAFRAGMAPITIALLVCTGWVLVAQVPGWRPILLACATALLVWRTRIHLLWLIAGGAVAGAIGWV